MAIEKTERTNKQTLDKIIDEMTRVVEKSKDEIFYISEEAMEELRQLQKELEKTKRFVKEYIVRGDKLEIEVKKSRQRLSLVSREFNRYTEEDIREVYEKTHNLQTELAILRQEEKQLRQRRDDLERRIERLKKTIEHANNLGRKVSVVLTYLHDDFSNVNEILKTAKEKQEFGLKIIEAQEMERKRLSREIHDGPAQMLANILIRSEIVDLAFREGNVEQALEEVKSIRGNIKQSLHEVRRIIYDLRPMALDDLGLFPTIKKHIKTMSDYYEVPIDLTLLGDERRLDPYYEVAVFRVVQEALQNAINHAQAKLIKVLIEVRSEHLTVIVKDDGIGFDPSIQKENSFGLIGMRERIEILDGELNISSEPGFGTTVRMKIPLKEAE